MGDTLRVLCLDIEGGYGGSSRSLYQAIRHIDRSKVSIEVWCRKVGPIQAKYAELGIPTRVEPMMTNSSSLSRLSRTLFNHTREMLRSSGSKHFCETLSQEVNKRFDCVHFNHEGLWQVARHLRSRSSVPFVQHIRKQLPDNWTSRLQAKSIKITTDHRIFISENEQRLFGHLSGDTSGTVIYNIADLPAVPPSPLEALAAEKRLKVASLANFAWVRGVDRILDIADILRARGRTDIVFVIAGKMDLQPSLPGEFGEVGRARGSLADIVAQRGLADMFLFLGHVTEPLRVLTGCDMLVRAARIDNPWGRDIIEAMSMARPVVTAGSWAGFVETDQTGILLGEFDAYAMAEAIITLANDPALCARLGDEARNRIMRLCGPHRADDLLAVWQSVVTTGRH